jgi:hypothetical protein
MEGTLYSLQKQKQTFPLLFFKQCDHLDLSGKFLGVVFRRQMEKDNGPEFNYIWL